MNKLQYHIGLFGAAAAAAVAITACNDLPTAPGVDQVARVAVTQRNGDQPALFFGDVSGASRERIHFSFITDSIPDNLPGLIPTDSNLIALGSPSISPSGDRIAVVATVAYDQSEIIVMRANDSGYVASINTQIIASDPEWSPDGTKLAYVMSTLPNFRGLDLFVTDLATKRVTRMTTNANIRNGSIVWSADGGAIYYSGTTGTSPDSPNNWVSEVVKVDVATKSALVMASNILGQVTSIARSGNRMLLTRTVTQGADTTRALIASTIGPAPTEQVLAGGVAYAHFLTGSDTYAVVVIATNDGGNVTDRFLLADIVRNTAIEVAGVQSQSGYANVDVMVPN